MPIGTIAMMFFHCSRIKYPVAETKPSVALLQLEGLKKQPHIVVATPGRLLDLYDEGAVNLGKA